MPDKEKDFGKGEKRPTQQDKDREEQRRKAAAAAIHLANKDKRK